MVKVSRKILQSLNSLALVYSICSDFPFPIFNFIDDFENSFASKTKLVLIYHY